MTPARFAPLALLVLAAWAATGAAAAPPPGGAGPEARRIAFLGLRPAADGPTGPTAIAQLAEAQRLRAVAENVVEVLTGAKVLRHDELRAAIGRTYLVDLFDCRGEVTCQLRVAGPLGRQGIQVAMVGDYHAEGTALRIRVRRLDLAAGRLLEEASFSAERSLAEAFAPWQEALQPLFLDTGTIRIVANVTGAACTLDGRPCEPGGDGLLTVEEGEHVLQLSKEGYRHASRVVAVKRGEEQRVAVALEELPVQVQAAPDPAARLPVFASPTAETQVAPFGTIRLAILYDDVNEGELEDLVVPPVGTPSVREGTVVFFPRPAVLGLGMQAPQSESGWQLRGGFGLALVRGDLPEFDSAFAELLRPEAGLRLMLGWGAPIVSGLTAGTLTLPEGFGDLAPGMVGVTASKSVGPVLLEAFVGKHKGMFTAAPEARAATPWPMVAARVAYIDEARKGRLYGAAYPLTLSLSGVFGTERVGLAAEQAFAREEGPIPNATFDVAPRVEDLAVWAGSLELFVPFGEGASLAGEGYVGQGARRFEGALQQAPRIDPATGRHVPLRSAGGWAQLAITPSEGFALHLVAGIDRILDGLEGGLAPDGADAIRENRLAALNGVWYLLDHLTLGVQLHVVQTVYDDPTQGRPRVLGAALTSRLAF